MKWKIEELLEREQSEENCPRVLYRGDWFQRSGCYCSGLVPKYAQRVCRQLGELSVKGDDLLEQIKPILKRYLQGLSWWDKMKDPISNWDALVLAQHYGLDTRFLDWSSNPRVALYFATHKFENGRCVPKRKDDGDSVIWICDLNRATRCNRQKGLPDWYADPKTEKTPFWRDENLRTLFYRPNSRDNLGERVKNQGSVMCRQVFYPTDQAYGKCCMIPLDKNVDFSGALEHVVISALDYTKIDRELLKQDIAADFIFPDRNDDCKRLEKALQPLSNWPCCPWER